MKTKNLILAIESSCDDSSIAIINRINYDCVFYQKISQELLHAEFGGVVPELAARLHTAALPRILALAKPYFSDICAVAVTSQPGLSVSLLGGVTMAKILSAALKVPLIAVNHLIGHIYSLFLAENACFEMGVLLVSGGHTMIISIDKSGGLEILANTSDDSFGESFDKVAKMLSLGYPGGIEIENLAQKFVEFKAKNLDKNAFFDEQNLGKNTKNSKTNLKDSNLTLNSTLNHTNSANLKDLNLTLNSTLNHTNLKRVNLKKNHAKPKNPALNLENTLKFPVPLRNSPNLEFSFSGLKNAVRVKIADFEALNLSQISAQKSPNLSQISAQKSSNLSQIQKAEIAFAFEEAAIAHILDKTKKAFKMRKFHHFGVVGGASANLKLRTKIKDLCDEFSCKLYLAPLKFCADNALMIARAACEKFKRGEFSEISADIISPKNRNFERI